MRHRGHRGMTQSIVDTCLFYKSVRSLARQHLQTTTIHLMSWTDPQSDQDFVSSAGSGASSDSPQGMVTPNLSYSTYQMCTLVELADEEIYQPMVLGAGEGSELLCGKQVCLFPLYCYLLSHSCRLNHTRKPVPSWKLYTQNARLVRWKNFWLIPGSSRH